MKTKKRRCITSLWKHAEGRIQILEMLEKQMPQADASALTEGWWQEHRPKASTSLPMRCLRCGHNGHIKLEKIVSGRTQFACECNGKMVWEGDAGRERFIKMLQENPRLQRFDRSLLTQSLWEELRPNCSTKIPLVCTICNYTSVSTSLNDMRKQGSPCFCPDQRSPPWGLLETFHYVTKHLEETLPELDSNEVTLEWWKDNQPISARTLLPLRCRSCSERSHLSIFDLMRHKKRLRCICAKANRSKRGVRKRMRSSACPSERGVNTEPHHSQASAGSADCVLETSEHRLWPARRFRWCEEEGYMRAVQILRENYRGWDISNITEGWWSSHKPTTHTILPLRCLTCGHQARCSSLSRVQQRALFPCKCKGLLKWSSAEGYARYLELCIVFQDTLVMEQFSVRTWALNIQSIESTVKCSCAKCGIQQDVRLHALHTANARKNTMPMPCLCDSRGLKWNTRIGFERFHDIVRSRATLDASAVTWQWWSQHVHEDGRKATPPLKCVVCEYETITTVNRIQQGLGAGCWCNTGALWRSQSGYERLVKMFSYCSHLQLSKNVGLQWWLAQEITIESRIPVICSRCLYQAEQSIHSFLSGQCIRCACRHKTEAYLKEYLDGIYAGVLYQPPACMNPVTKRILWFDFAILDALVNDDNIVAYIELDGGLGHFGKGWGGVSDFGAPMRDLVKETWSLRQGRSVIRVLQEDVWKNQFDWQGYLRRSIDTAVHLKTQSMTPRVFTPTGASVYEGGIYAELRCPRASTCPE